jgi:acetyl-CoA carboxylase biotin carboxyl carrier protein
MSAYVFQNGDSMDIQDIKELIELIQDSSIEEFEMEKEGTRVRIRQSTTSSIQPVLAPAPAVSQETAPAAAGTASPAEGREEEEDLHIFKAPIVGTYYITPKPDAEQFVNIGDRVNKSTVLCIIEAMKIFNQIECDVNGVIVDILVENGQPVEFGEPLFKIRLS